jgi:acyl-CoA thioesterase-1
MKANLEAMIEQSRQAGAHVVLVGMRMPPNYGPDYTDAFASTYYELGKSRGTVLVPFLLEDLVYQPELFQGDRIHPNEAAQPLMLERVWKALRPLLK